MQFYGRVCSFVLLFGFISYLGCGNSAKQLSQSANSQTSTTTSSPEQNAQAANDQPGVSIASNEAFIAEHRQSIEKFCGDCHAPPQPASAGRDEWLGEIEQGLSIYEFTGRTDLAIPSKAIMRRYFEIQSPDKLLPPASVFGYPKTTLPFSTASVRATSDRSPGISNVRWIDIGLNEMPAMVYCDVNTGAVNAHWFDEQNTRVDRSGKARKLATLLQPVHVEPCDLDRDGLVDLLVADIGEFHANDSDLGRVIWIRRESADSDRFESIVLGDGLSRVADVQSGDFDSDGDTDVLVGEFGWRTTGKIFMMVNVGLDDEQRPQFESRIIDKRSGTVNVPPVDLDGDGDLDFVALISQEHEVVEAFLNDGTGSFSNHVIWQASDPAYGSSGINLVDLDLDGDLDVLYTNGDSFDRGFKPHHSIQWLENQGTFPYVHHAIVNMPGVLNAKAADFDGDSDMDIVACSLLAGGVEKEFASIGVSSIVILTQTEPGKFVPSMMESGRYNHASLEVADFDKDGRFDFAVGNFLKAGSPNEPDVEIWFNVE